MTQVKFRAYDERLRPRRTRLEVPGWAGGQAPRQDGSQEYPWHCVPFSEAARAGVELCFPYDEALHVRLVDGLPAFETAEGARWPADEGPPFRSFGRDYYTFRSSIDLKVAPEFAIKVETHPRFYTDTTGTAPVAVPAVLHAWWPMIHFLVFKAPPAGGVHIFRPGEGFVLITVVAADQSVELADMAADEAAERELQSRRIYASRSTLSAGTQWTSATNTVFDGTYRLLAGAARSARAKADAAAREPATPDDYGGGGGGGAQRAAAAAAAPAQHAPAGGDDGGGGGDGDGAPLAAPVFQQPPAPAESAPAPVVAPRPAE